jgi:hypothetical protein
MHANTKTPSHHLFSTRIISTTMAPIDDAIAELESLQPGEKLCYTTTAKKHGVVRSTLMQRYTGQTRARNERDLDQWKLNPQQEHELILYIEHLTRQGLPPTRSMVQNFAATIAQTAISELWVTRFLDRNPDAITTKWTTSMDAVRHHADSGLKYKLYYDLLHSKMSQYEIEPMNSYNVDEKGFMISQMKRSKQVFSKWQ